MVIFSLSNACSLAWTTLFLPISPLSALTLEWPTLAASFKGKAGAFALPMLGRTSVTGVPLEVSNVGR
jgi:hypothetical protein